MTSSVIESWPYFRYLFLEGLGIVVIPPFGVAAVLLTAGMVASFFAQNPAKAGRWKHHYWLILSQLVFYPAVIAIGVIYASPRRPIDPLPKINPVAEGALDAITCLSLALGVFWVWRLKGVRWIAFFFVALQLLFLYGALFLAGMSISGDWI